MQDEEMFEDDMEELSSAEEFLQYFEIEYDQSVVHVNRLHILQRFHNYLAEAEDGMPEYEEGKREVYKELLEKAYQDFVGSDAATEKVLKIYRMQEPQQVFVSLDSLVK